MPTPNQYLLGGSDPSPMLTTAPSNGGAMWWLDPQQRNTVSSVISALASPVTDAYRHASNLVQGRGDWGMELAGGLLSAGGLAVPEARGAAAVAERAAPEIGSAINAVAQRRLERFNWPVTTITGKTMDMPVLINPSRREIAETLSAAPKGDVRALRSPDGDVYLWPANEAMHVDIANSFDLPFKTRQQLQGASYLFNKKDVPDQFSNFDDLISKMSTQDQ